MGNFVAFVAAAKRRHTAPVCSQFIQTIYIMLCTIYIYTLILCCRIFVHQLYHFTCHIKPLLKHGVFMLCIHWYRNLASSIGAGSFTFVWAQFNGGGAKFARSSFIVTKNNINNYDDIVFSTTPDSIWGNLGLWKRKSHSRLDDICFLMGIFDRYFLKLQQPQVTIRPPKW